MSMTSLAYYCGQPEQYDENTILNEINNYCYHPNYLLYENYNSHTIVFGLSRG